MTHIASTEAAPLKPSFEPAPGVEAAEGLLSPARQAQCIAWFMVLGVAARCVRYFLNFPLWEDECFLCVNFIDRGFAGMLEPLDFHQVAPPLFLWIEVAAVKVLGYGERSLRLFPFLCSVASLFVFRHLAARLVRGPALVLAVAVFACAYPCIRYAAEAKQYASDMLASVLLLSLAVAWWQEPRRRRWMPFLALIAPVAVGLSYPAAFVGGGISLFAAAVLIAEQRPRGDWLGWAAFNALLLAGFAAVYLASARSQSRAELEFMTRCWQHAFPPWRTPLKLPEWLVMTHASDLLAFPIGGQRGASLLTFLGFVAGIAMLARKKNWMWLLLALGPFAVHLAAAAMERYPYGGHVKFSQHLAPMIVLIAALGSTAWIALLGKRRRLQRVALVGLLGFPALIGAGTIARDVAMPYKTESDMRARAFAQWFWFNAEFEGEVVCLKTDLHQNLAPDTYRELNWTATYLCNQRIYSPRHRAGGGGARLETVSAERPVRFVLYRDPKFAFDEEGLARWLAEQETHYRLVGRETYPFPRYDKRERTLLQVDYLEEFKFVPRTAPSIERTATPFDRDRTRR